MAYIYSNAGVPLSVQLSPDTVDVGVVTAAGSSQSGAAQIPWGGTERTVVEVIVPNGSNFAVNLPDTAPVGVVVEVWTANNATPDLEVFTGGQMRGSTTVLFGGAIFRKVEEGSPIRWARMS